MSCFMVKLENAPRTTGAYFAHRAHIPYHHASENASRTTGAYFAHRAHIPYHRRPSPVPNEPNAENAMGKKPLPV